MTTEKVVVAAGVGLGDRSVTTVRPFCTVVFTVTGTGRPSGPRISTALKLGVTPGGKVTTASPRCGLVGSLPIMTRSTIRGSTGAVTKGWENSDVLPSALVA